MSNVPDARVHYGRTGSAASGEMTVYRSLLWVMAVLAAAVAVAWVVGG